MVQRKVSGRVNGGIGMKYVIDEDELKELIWNYDDTTLRENYIKDFLKSKKTVKEIAINIPDTTKSAYLFLTEMNGIGQVRNRKLYKTKGKTITIYVGSE